MPDCHLRDATLQPVMEVVAVTIAIDITMLSSIDTNTTLDTNTGGTYIHWCI